MTKICWRAFNTNEIRKREVVPLSNVSKWVEYVSWRTINENSIRNKINAFFNPINLVLIKAYFLYREIKVLSFGSIKSFAHIKFYSKVLLFEFLLRRDPRFCGLWLYYLWFDGFEWVHFSEKSYMGNDLLKTISENFWNNLTYGITKIYRTKQRHSFRPFDFWDKGDIGFF